MTSAKPQGGTPLEPIQDPEKPARPNKPKINQANVPKHLKPEVDRLLKDCKHL